MTEKAEFDQQTGIYRIGDKYFIERKSTKKKDKRTWHKTYLQEIDKEDYLKRIDKLVEAIAEHPEVDIRDILWDKFTTMSYSNLEKTEKWLENELKKKKPIIKTTRGHCVELNIGSHYRTLR